MTRLLSRLLSVALTITLVAETVPATAHQSPKSLRAPISRMQVFSDQALESRLTLFPSAGRPKITLFQKAASVLGTPHARQAPFLEWRYSLPFVILRAESYLRKTAWRVDPALTRRVPRTPWGRTAGWAGSLIAAASLIAASPWLLPAGWLSWSILSGFVFSGAHHGTSRGIFSPEGRRTWAMGALLAGLTTVPVFLLAGVGLPAPVFLLLAAVLLPTGLLFNVSFHLKRNLNALKAAGDSEERYHPHLQSQAFTFWRPLKRLGYLSVPLFVAGMVAVIFRASPTSHQESLLIAGLFAWIFVVVAWLDLPPWVTRKLEQARRAAARAEGPPGGSSRSPLRAAPAQEPESLPAGVDPSGAIIPGSLTAMVQRNQVVLEGLPATRLAIGLTRATQPKEISRIEVLIERYRKHLSRYPQSHGSADQRSQAEALLSLMRQSAPHIRLLEDHPQVWGYSDGETAFMSERLFESPFRLEALAYLMSRQLQASDPGVSIDALMEALFGARAQAFAKAMVQFRLANQTRPVQRWTSLDFTQLPLYESKQAMAWNTDRQNAFRDRMARTQTLEEKEIQGIRFAIEPGILTTATESLLARYLASDEAFRQALSGRKVYLGRLGLIDGQWQTEDLVEGFAGPEGSYYVGLNEYLARNAQSPELNAACAVYRLGRMTGQFPAGESDRDRLENILSLMGAEDKPIEHRIRDKRISIESGYWRREDQLWSAVRRESDEAAGVKDEFGDDSAVYRETRDIFDRLLLAAGLIPSKYRLLLVDEKTVNAFAVSNTNIVIVHRALLEQALALSGDGAPFNKDLVASLLAHELGHILQSYRAVNDGTVDVQRTFLNEKAHRYSSLEKDSDLNWMLDLMDRAGFDVNQAPNLFRLLQKHLKQTAGAEPIFGDHPALSTRIRDVEASIGRRTWKSRRGFRYRGQPFSDSFLEALASKRLRQRDFLDQVHGIKNLTEAAGRGFSDVSPADLRSVGDFLILNQFGHIEKIVNLESRIENVNGVCLVDYLKGLKGTAEGTPEDIALWMNSIVHDRAFLVREEAQRGRLPASLHHALWDEHGDLLPTAKTADLERANRLVLEAEFPGLLRRIADLETVLQEASTPKEVQLAVHAGISGAFDAQVVHYSDAVMDLIRDDLKAFDVLLQPLRDVGIMPVNPGSRRRFNPAGVDFERSVRHYVALALLRQTPGLDLASQIRLDAQVSFGDPKNHRDRASKLNAEFERILPALQSACRVLEQTIFREMPPALLAEETRSFRAQTRALAAEGVRKVETDPAMAHFPPDIFRHLLYAVFEQRDAHSADVPAIFEEEYGPGWLPSQKLQRPHDVPDVDDLLPIWDAAGVDGGGRLHDDSLLGLTYLIEAHTQLLKPETSSTAPLEHLFRQYDATLAVEKSVGQYYSVSGGQVAQRSYELLEAIVGHLAANPGDLSLKRRVVALLKARSLHGYSSPVIAFIDHLADADPAALYEEVRDIVRRDSSYEGDILKHLDRPGPHSRNLRQALGRLERLTGISILDLLSQSGRRSILTGEASGIFFNLYRQSDALQRPFHDRQVHALALSYLRDLMVIRADYLRKQGKTEPMVPDAASELLFRGLAGQWEMTPSHTEGSWRRDDQRAWFWRLAREDHGVNDLVSPWLWGIDEDDVYDWDAFLGILKGDPRTPAYRLLAQALPGRLMHQAGFTLETIRSDSFKVKDLDALVDLPPNGDFSIKRIILWDLRENLRALLDDDSLFAAELTPEGLRISEQGQTILWLDRNHARYHEIRSILETCSKTGPIGSGDAAGETIPLTHQALSARHISNGVQLQIAKALFKAIFAQADARLFPAGSPLPPLQHHLDREELVIEPYPVENLPDFRRLAADFLDRECRSVLVRYGQEELLGRLPRCLKAFLVTIAEGGVPNYSDLEYELKKLNAGRQMPAAAVLRDALKIASDLLRRQDFHAPVTRANDYGTPSNTDAALRKIKEKLHPRTADEYLTYLSWLTYFVTLKESAGADPALSQRAEQGLAWFLDFTNPSSDQLAPRDAFFGELMVSPEKLFQDALSGRSPLAPDGLNLTRFNFAAAQRTDADVMAGFDLMTADRESFQDFLKRITEPEGAFALAPGVLRNYLIWYQYLRKVVFPHLTGSRFADLKEHPFHAPLTVWRDAIRALPASTGQEIFAEYSRMASHLAYDSRTESLNQIMQGTAIYLKKLTFQSVDQRRTQTHVSLLEWVLRNGTDVRSLHWFWKAYRLGKGMREQFLRETSGFQRAMLPQFHRLYDALPRGERADSFGVWLAQFGDADLQKLAAEHSIRDRREDDPALVELVAARIQGTPINLDPTLEGIRTSIEDLMRSSSFPFDWFLRQYFTWKIFPPGMSPLVKTLRYLDHSLLPQAWDAVRGRYGNRDYQDLGLPSPYTSVEFFQPGNISSDLTHLASEMNLDKIQEDLAWRPTVQGKISRLKELLSEKSRHRDQWLKALFTESKRMAEILINADPAQPLTRLAGNAQLAGHQSDMLLLAQEFSSDLLIDQARLAALELEHLLRPEAFQRAGRPDIRAELTVVERFFPDFSLTRDDLLRSMLERAETLPEAMEIQAKMLTDRKNLKKEEVARKTAILDKVFELFQALPALDKAEFILWVLGIKNEKPFFLLQWEFAMKVDFGSLREMLSSRQSLRIERLSADGNVVDQSLYGETGYSLRKTLLLNFFEGDDGILRDLPAKEYFLQGLFDALIDKKTTDRQLLWQIQRSIFRRAPREVQLRLVESLLQNQLQFLKDRSASKSANRNRAIRMFLDASGLIGKKLGQILGYSTLLKDKALRKELQQLGNSAAADDRGIMMEEIHTLYEGRLPIRRIVRRLGSASVGIVYLVELLDGRLAVGKIKRPSIDNIVKQEMDTFEEVQTDLGHENNGLDEAVHEAVRQEMDFIREAQNQARMAAFYATHPNRASPQHGYRFGVPAVHSSPTLGREQNQMLLQEYLDGFVSLGKVIGNTDRRFDVPAVKKLVFKELLRQLFIDGFFHADPHGDNILINKAADGTVDIDFIDWGSVGTLAPEKCGQVLRWLFQMAVSRKMNGWFAPRIPVNEVLISMFFAKLGYLYEGLSTEEISKMILEVIRESQQNSPWPGSATGIRRPWYATVVVFVARYLLGSAAAELISFVSAQNRLQPPEASNRSA